MKKRNGFALVTVLAVLIVAALIAIGIIQAMNTFTGMKQMGVDGIEAQYIAEAAMQYAVWKARKGELPVGSSAVTIEGYDTTIQNTVAADSTDPNQITITVNY